MIGVSWLSLSFGRNFGRSEGWRLLGTERFGNPEIECNTMCIQHCLKWGILQQLIYRIRHCWGREEAPE